MPFLLMQDVLYLYILKGTEMCTNISMYNDMLGDNIVAKILLHVIGL